MDSNFKSNYGMILLLCAILLFVLPDKVISKYRTGLKAGVNYTWPYPKNYKPYSRSFPAGYFAGISIQVNKTNYLSFIPELLVVKGTQYVEYYDASEFPNLNKFTYYSLLCPMMLKVKINNFIYFNTGPTLGYLIRATYKATYNESYGINNLSPVNVTQELPNFDLNYAIGIGNEIQYQKCRIGLELRYLIGLTRYRHEKYPWDWRNHSVQAGLNFLF